MILPYLLIIFFFEGWISGKKNTFAWAYEISQNKNYLPWHWLMLQFAFAKRKIISESWIWTFDVRSEWLRISRFWTCFNILSTQKPDFEGRNLSSLNHYCMNYFFVVTRDIAQDKLLIFVYRLIVAMLKGDFLRIPSKIEDKYLVKRPIYRKLCTNGLTKFVNLD